MNNEVLIIILLVLIFLSLVIILSILVWGVNKYHGAQIKLRQYAKYVTKAMDMDELLAQHVPQEQEIVKQSNPPGQNEHCQKQRERLAALASGGQAKQYLGKAVTADQVDEMEDEEIGKLYARYEARLGAAMTKTIGQAALQLYVGVVSRFLPIPVEHKPMLFADLEADPFVGHALSTASCELYHRYGMCLAPLTAALTTARHCRIENTDTRNIDSEDVGESEHTGGSCDSIARESNITSERS